MFHCMMEEKMTVTSSSEQQQAPERRTIDQSKIAYQKPQPAGMVRGRIRRLRVGA